MITTPANGLPAFRSSVPKKLLVDSVGETKAPPLTRARRNGLIRFYRLISSRKPLFISLKS
jgi:hypothetical protein